MSTATQLLTYDEVRTLPDLGEHYELIDGVLIVPPSPLSIHALLIMRLIDVVRTYLEPRQLKDYLFTAPFDVRLGERTVVQPDLFYVSPEGPAVIEPDSVDGPPTLIVEILSPSSRYHDLVTKFGLYQRAGVAEYWPVDPQHEALTVFALLDGRFVEQVHDGVTARSAVLPDLTVKLPDLFANLPPGIRA